MRNWLADSVCAITFFIESNCKAFPIMTFDKMAKVHRQSVVSMPNMKKMHLLTQICHWLQNYLFKNLFKTCHILAATDFELNCQSESLLLANKCNTTKIKMVEDQTKSPLRHVNQLSSQLRYMQFRNSPDRFKFFALQFSLHGACIQSRWFFPNLHGADNPKIFKAPKDIFLSKYYSCPGA